MLLVARPADGSDSDSVSDVTALRCRDKTLAKQEFKEECDINTLIKRFGVGYEIPSGVRVPMYGDFVDAIDYQSSLDAIRAAADSFMQMSAEVRSEFANDPARFVEFCSKEENLPRMRKLGLAVPELEPVVPPVAPSAPPGGAPVVP